MIFLVESNPVQLKAVEDQFMKLLYVSSYFCTFTQNDCMLSGNCGESELPASAIWLPLTRRLGLAAFSLAEHVSREQSVCVCVSVCVFDYCSLLLHL